MQSLNQYLRRVGTRLCVCVYFCIIKKLAYVDGNAYGSRQQLQGFTLGAVMSLSCWSSQWPVVGKRKEFKKKAISHTASQRDHMMGLARRGRSRTPMPKPTRVLGRARHAFECAPPLLSTSAELPKECWQALQRWSGWKTTRSLVSVALLPVRLSIPFSLFPSLLSSIPLSSLLLHPSLPPLEE